MVLKQALRDVADDLSTGLASLDSGLSIHLTDQLYEASTQVGKAWSGSWIGYQSRVYYAEFRVPPPGEHFNTEWGHKQLEWESNLWTEYRFDDVIAHIYDLSGNPDLSTFRNHSSRLERLFQANRSKARSLLAIHCKDNNDPIIRELYDAVTNLNILNSSHYINKWKPSGHVITRDRLAHSQGIQTPPHLHVLADISAIQSPIESCEALRNHVENAADHLDTLGYTNMHSGLPTGNSIFIAHGHSSAWKDLKDFLQDRLSLRWDEFNRVPAAGVATATRLSEMLDNASFAFIVMTAEDEQLDGSFQARLNVVHEAGLFQGRLGFERAIILLEEGCEEFSNIHGIGQIRFPRNRIRASFEDIREVLEREGIVEG